MCLLCSADQDECTTPLNARHQRMHIMTQCMAPLNVRHHGRAAGDGDRQQVMGTDMLSDSSPPPPSRRATWHTGGGTQHLALNTSAARTYSCVHQSAAAQPEAAQTFLFNNSTMVAATVFPAAQAGTLRAAATAAHCAVGCTAGGAIRCNSCS